MQSRTSDVVLEMDHHHHRPKPATTRSQSMKDDDLITSRQDHHHHHRPKPTKTLRRLSLSKPKARLLEYNYPPPSSIPENINSPNNNDHKPTHSDDSSSSQDDDEWSHDDDDFEEMGTSPSSSKQKLHRRRKKFPLRYFIECVMFMAILACLVTSLTVHPFNRRKRVWKWCLMVMVTFCGRLVSGWMMAVAVFAIERNFMLREKVLYFVYGLRKGIQNCVWLGLVLLSWTFVFSPQLHKKYKLLDRVYRGLVAVLVAAVIWLVKIVLVKTLASSFHVATYFDRMKESVFHHYVLDTLSGPPAERAAVEQRSGLMESKSMPADGGRRRKRRVLGKSRSTNTTSSSRKDTVEELRRLSLESRTSAWGIRRLVNHVMTSGLSTISKTVDDFAKAESEIGSEWQARGAAKRIFSNVAKPGAKYIEEEDLMRFLSRVEIHTIFPFFEGALETGRISKPSFRNWVVRAYLERKSLAHSLNDTRTAVHQLHKLASVVVVVIIAAVTVVLMGLANLQVIFFVTTQMVVVGVIFQNMCRNVFESIVFVFIMHPFDIGDRCVVDGVQMVVEEMNILTTVFLRYDNEKIYYPNSVLLTKPISNFYRSPEMSDAVNFSVDISTSMDTIHALKKAIQIYIESKPGYWNPKHSVVVKEIAPMNLMNMALCVQHTINHQNYGERNYRMTELILELKGMFDNLGIRYRLLPQEIHLTRRDRFDDDTVVAKND